MIRGRSYRDDYKHYLYKSKQGSGNAALFFCGKPDQENTAAL